MTKEDKHLMKTLGITRTIEFSYHFQGHYYQKLQDVIDYASKEKQRQSAMIQESNPDEDKETH
ncbi:hypothetical protein LJ739_13650 [Aestuariibacter halophilus]|uniref:Uncharacterized protein n=1 Tax=Fluctibacter halophilus TaxID=226011 RepID=A0ABS8G9W3_9ALTE|nr:hypothetical protein [Aestuariibacter halophilus]MCC2617293.1 hypothetical protein [Aestuariibacter halophilus]